MKKIIKILFVIIFMLGIVFMFNNVSQAADDIPQWTPDFTAVERKSGGKAEGAAKKVTGSIITIIRVIGTGISLIMITWVAIKYMMAAPSERAEYKKSATALIVGAVVLFAASNLVYIIADFATSNI